MTITAKPAATATATSSPSLGRLLLAGVVATAAASVATAAVAPAGHAAGVSLDVNGAAIPVTGFAVLTALFSIVGLILAAVLSRTVRHPQRVFVRTTVVLTVLSLVPDAIAPATPATKALLMLTHLVAAAIVIPAVARRLAA